MPPEGDEQDLPGEAPDPVAEAIAATEASLAQVPANVRNTPEFKALSKQLRQSAREKGAAIAAANAAREEAQTFRQAAEAERQASIEAQLQATLGDDGIAAFQEIAELSETDPVAAAARFQELVRVQSQASLAAAVAVGTPPAGGTAVPVPPLPSGGVDPNAPLQPNQPDPTDTLIASLDATYKDVVERNQSPLLRNRVTMKDRAAGFIAYVGSAYTQAMRDR